MSKEIQQTLLDMEDIKDTPRYKFWCYMRDYHGILLTESEIDDIIKMVEEIQGGNDDN